MYSIAMRFCVPVLIIVSLLVVGCSDGEHILPDGETIIQVHYSVVGSPIVPVQLKEFTWKKTTEGYGVGKLPPTTNTRITSSFQPQKKTFLYYFSIWSRSR
jgi:hypothetical protein